MSKSNNKENISSRVFSLNETIRKVIAITDFCQIEVILKVL